MAIINIKSDYSDLFIQDWSGNTSQKPSRYQIGNTVVYVDELRTGLKKNQIEQEVIQTEKFFKTTVMHILREEEFEDGKISIKESRVVVTKGQEITAEAASIFQKLNILNWFTIEWHWNS